MASTAIYLLFMLTACSTYGTHGELTEDAEVQKRAASNFRRKYYHNQMGDHSSSERVSLSSHNGWWEPDTPGDDDWDLDANSPSDPPHGVDSFEPSDRLQEYLMYLRHYGTVYRFGFDEGGPESSSSWWLDRYWRRKRRSARFGGGGGGPNGGSGSEGGVGRDRGSEIGFGGPTFAKGGGGGGVDDAYGGGFGWETDGGGGGSRTGGRPESGRRGSSGGRDESGRNHGQDSIEDVGQDLDTERNEGSNVVTEVTEITDKTETRPQGGQTSGREERYRPERKDSDGKPRVNRVKGGRRPGQTNGQAGRDENRDERRDKKGGRGGRGGAGGGRGGNGGGWGGSRGGASGSRGGGGGGNRRQYGDNSA